LLQAAQRPALEPPPPRLPRRPEALVSVAPFVVVGSKRLLGGIDFGEPGSALGVTAGFHGSGQELVRV